MKSNEIRTWRASALAVACGFAGYLLSLHSFPVFEAGLFKVGIVPVLVFPVLVGFMIGPGWAVLASAVAMAAMNPWAIYREYGLSVPLYLLVRLLWVAWHGTAFPFRKRTGLSPYLKELIISVPMNLIVVLLFPILSPHEFFRDAKNLFSPPELQWGLPTVLLQGVLNRMSAILVADYLSRLAVVKRLFGGRAEPGGFKKSVPLLIGPAAAVTYWILDAGLLFLLSGRRDTGFLEYLRGASAGQFYSRVLVTCICLTGSILFHEFVKRMQIEHESRISAEERMRSQEEEYKKHLERLVVERARSLSQFASLVENSGDFIGMADLEGKVLYVNRAGRELAGIGDREDLAISDFTPGDSSMFRDETMPALFREGKWYGEGFINDLSSGEKIPVLLHVFLLNDEATDRPYRICTIIRDARPQLDARSRIKESGRRMEALLNAITEAAFLTSPDGTILEANRTIAKRLNVDLRELIGRNIRDFAPPDVSAYRASKAMEMIEKKEPVRFEDQIHGHVNDMVFYPVFDDGGNVTACAIFARDITALKEAERQKKRYTEELERSNQELERFAYISSHDLQEPLRSIVSFLQLLEKRYGDKLDDKAREYIDRAVKAAMRLAAMIQDLLDYSRVSSRGSGFSPTNLNAAVRSAVDDLHKAIEQTKATITVHPLPGVFADPSQMSRLFLNLVGNAIKYSREGIPPIVEISSEKTGEFWTISVKDNGIGIEAVYFDRVFEVFQRLHSKDLYEGTGIGLAVCKRIVERHGGRIWIESTPGEGSVFRFTIPDKLGEKKGAPNPGAPA